jgi:hypothetical protein
MSGNGDDIFTVLALRAHKSTTARSSGIFPTFFPGFDMNIIGTVFLVLETFQCPDFRYAFFFSAHC